MGKRAFLLLLLCAAVLSVGPSGSWAATTCPKNDSRLIGFLGLNKDGKAICLCGEVCPNHPLFDSDAQCTSYTVSGGPGVPRVIKGTKYCLLPHYNQWWLARGYKSYPCEASFNGKVVKSVKAADVPDCLNKL